MIIPNPMQLLLVHSAQMACSLRWSVSQQNSAVWISHFIVGFSVVVQVAILYRVTTRIINGIDECSSVSVIDSLKKPNIEICNNGLLSLQRLSDILY